MELQLILPNESATMCPERLVELSRAAEESGYTTAWLPDHLLPPKSYGEVYGGVYEPLVTIAHLAAHTERLRFGTSVLVLPMRNPFVVAKQTATVHQLTGGRFTLGVGIGWDATEFAAVGADYPTRAARTDEGLRLLRRLFAGDTGFDGEFHRYTVGHFEPRVHGDIPIMVGGMSERALRRAAEHADEWQAITEDPAEFDRLATILAGYGGRRPRAGTRIAWPAGTTPHALAGTVRALADAGARSVAVHAGDGEDAAGRVGDLADALR